MMSFVKRFLQLPLMLALSAPLGVPLTVQVIAPLAVAMVAAAPEPAQAAFTVVSSAKSSTVGANSTTTGTFDSTGANTLISFEAWYNAGTTPSLDDSVTHAPWTCKTIYEEPAVLLKTRLCSLHIASTSAMHTVTSAGSSAYTGLVVLALSGGGFAPDDTGITNDGDDVSSTRFDFNSVTPSEDDCIVILGIGNILGDFSVDLTSTGYTLVQALTYSSSNSAAWMAYKIQTTAGAEAPSLDNIKTNSFLGSEHGSIGSFKTSGAAPASAHRGLTLRGVR